MTRVKRSVPAMRRHKKILKMAKGYRGRSSTCFRIAVERVEKGLQYAYRDRRNRKRDFRAIWIQRINAATRQYDMKYSDFINAMKHLNIALDRKSLSEIAVNAPESFAELVNRAKEISDQRKAAANKANSVACKTKTLSC